MTSPIQAAANASFLVTVAELLDHPDPLCAKPGPAWSRCMRAVQHAEPCGALGTNRDGEPIVVTWYRPDTFPLGDVWTT